VSRAAETSLLPQNVGEVPGFRVALPPEADQPQAEAIASLPGIKIELCCELRSHEASSMPTTMKSSAVSTV